jgi:hypothetical protein
MFRRVHFVDDQPRPHVESRDLQQRDARHDPAAMSGFLAWLAARTERLRVRLPEVVRNTALRRRQRGCRDRAAKLYLGVRLFLDFTQEMGAINAAEKQALSKEAYRALAAIAERTGRLQADRRPTVLFLENLRALLAQGRGYLAERETGGAPGNNPSQWGYSVSAAVGIIRPHSGSEKLGWIDVEDDMVYFLPMAVHRAVTRVQPGRRGPVPRDPAGARGTPGSGRAAGPEVGGAHGVPGARPGQARVVLGHPGRHPVPRQ